MMNTKRLLVYVDGAARGNPGPAGAGVVILDEERNKVKEVYKSVGVVTNNTAEYNALILALKEARELGAKELAIYLDSELVAKQLKGDFRVKNKNIKPLFEEAITLINNFEKIEVIHIDRSLNKEADKLANKAINLSGLNTKIE